MQLKDDFGYYWDKPLDFVMFLFPWDTDESIQQVELAPKYQERFNCRYGPDIWACEFLDELGKSIKERDFDGRHAVDPVQFSTSSGHGIGKSALVAWLILFIMCTRPYCDGMVTATTETQLRTKTWAELGKWYRRSLAFGMFEYNTGRGAMSFFQPEHKEEWKVVAQTCREENSEAFAGLHAANSTPFYIFDEASGVPDKIFEVRNGGLTDGEPMTFDFGNPTRNTGQFYDNMEGDQKHRYIRRFIDSRTVAITNKKHFARMVEDYGEDSDYVRVRCRGLFPSVGASQFMPSEDVRRAMECEDMQPDRYAPLVIGVDVARYGDDETVVYPRLGRDARTYMPDRIRDPNTINIARAVIRLIEDFRRRGIEYSEVFVDSTGGYGGGVADQLRASGYHCVEINFGHKAPDDGYRYMSDYMWGQLREDIINGMVLPKMAPPDEKDVTLADTTGTYQMRENRLRREVAKDLYDQLTQRLFAYTLSGNKIHLETKADMKDRGVGSPDLVDALALTYAAPVNPRAPAPHGAQNTARMTKGHDFEPYSDME